jgi:predicted DCC family thiol-disulfide oxidoreductase YuxK
VLLFDGDCGLCTMLVRWLSGRRNGHRVGYLALQSPAAQRYLAAHGLPTRDFDSLVFVPDWHGPAAANYLLRTDGLFAALCVVGGPLSYLAALRFIPRPIRDSAYACVARLRHRWPR